MAVYKQKMSQLFNVIVKSYRSIVRNLVLKKSNVKGGDAMFGKMGENLKITYKSLKLFALVLINWPSHF